MPITPTSSISKNYQALGIDEIANDIETVFTSVNALETTINALPAAPTTTVVNISSAQILAMGVTPITLLSAPGSGKYYDWEMIIEFTAGANNYANTDNIWIYGDGEEYAQIYKDFITAGNDITANRIAFISSRSIGYGDNPSGGNYIFGEKINSPIKMKCFDGNNPTLGDGTIRAIITYTTRTFGA